MKVKLLEDEKVRLRPVEPEDLEILYTIENDPGMWDKGTVSIPYSRYALHRFIQETQNDLFVDRQLRLMAEDSSSGEVVGIVDLFNFDPRHLRAEIGIAILDAFRRKGYAAKAINLLCNYAHRALHLHSLSAWVAEDNQHSRELFIHCGFKENGKLQDWVSTADGFRDVIIYQRILDQ